MKVFTKILTCLLLAAGAHSATVAGTITKAPNMGAYWGPLATTGTYIYADSFVADTSGAVVDLGTWLYSGGSNFVLQIYDSILGDPALGPDSTSVFASTATIPGQNFSSLTFVNGGPVTSFSDLVAGHTYWFAASTVGQGGSGAYSVGGHTQNSGGIVDNGTFWFSNDPSGLYYDGRSLTPEMAFSVTIQSRAASVPEPSAIALLGLGLLGFAASRRKPARGRSA